MERQPVGIDGDGSRDVLQAGTEQEIVSFGFITVHATYAAPPKTEPRGNCAEWMSRSRP